MVLLCQKNYKIKKVIFDCDVVMTSRTPVDIYPREMVTRAKFNVCTPISFGGVKAHLCTFVQAELCFTC